MERCHTNKRNGWTRTLKISRATLGRTVVVAAGLMLAACTSIGERTQISVGYYTVKGETFSELDRQIALHGPNVAGVGKALAATSIRMIPDVRFALSRGECRITRARINVKARVTLPRHANIKRAERELQKAWNSLEEYARLHETVHVAIADKYALRAENRILRLKPQENCTIMRTKIMEISSEIFKQHDLEQLKFDADEQQRIGKLLAKQTSS